MYFLIKWTLWIDFVDSLWLAIHKVSHVLACTVVTPTKHLSTHMCEISSLLLCAHQQLSMRIHITPDDVLQKMTCDPPPQENCHGAIAAPAALYEHICVRARRGGGQA